MRRTASHGFPQRRSAKTAAMPSRASAWSHVGFPATSAKKRFADALFASAKRCIGGKYHATKQSDASHAATKIASCRQETRRVIASTITMSATAIAYSTLHHDASNSAASASGIRSLTVAASAIVKNIIPIVAA